MSLIKCPECGRTVSDLAPTCPGCGCPIEGNIAVCPACGTVNLKRNERCSACGADMKGGASVSGHTDTVAEPKHNIEAVQEKYNKAVADFNSGRRDEALAAMDELLAAYPNNRTFTEAREAMVKRSAQRVNDFADKAEDALRRGNCEEAERMIREGLIGDPSDVRLKSLLEAVRKRRRRKITTIFVSVVIFIAILASAAVWYVRDNSSTDDDDAAWEMVKLCESEGDCVRLDSALTAYVTTYADGVHIDEATAMQESLHEEMSDWNEALSECTVESMNRYMDKYANGHFYKEAYSKLDSLSFVDAFAANTEEAFNEYISEFPDGKYLADAQKWIETLKKDVLTPAEEQSALRCVRAHFDAMTSDDEATMRRTISSSLSSYIGKANATWDDVAENMEKVSKKSNGERLEPENCNVVKVGAGNGKYFYNVKFQLHRTLADGEVGDSTVDRTLSGTAILNGDMKITSLVLKGRP